MGRFGLILVLAAGCSGPAETTVSMDFDRDDFYDAPFPSEDLRNGAGTVDVAGFPNPDNVDFIADMIEVVDGIATGFGTTSAIYFSMTGAIDATDLPDVHASILPGSPVFLVSVDEDAPDFLDRYPIDVAYEADGGPFGARNQLALLPLQGIPLRPNTQYAAVVMRSLGDADGDPLSASSVMDELVAGRTSGVAALDAAAATLAANGVDLAQVAGLTTFITQDPTAGLARFLDHARDLDTPTPNAAFTRTDVFADYCVYESTVTMPVYQQGTPPFTTGGGGNWPADPVVQVMEQARIVVTIPRSPAPAGGYPLTVMIRTGGGGDRPLVDRGTFDDNGDLIVPGSGPAMFFARAGFAGVSVDGPHGGLRNITGGDEQLLIFNFTNPKAMLDNVRQSALEIALVPGILANVTIDVTDCAGASVTGDLLDMGHIALMGHSMGATIAPLVLALEPAYGLAIVSGAGGSWIENIVYKQSPFPIKPIAEGLLSYPNYGRSLHSHDPALSMLQWAGEAADPPPYGRLIIHEDPARARHVLMFQGIVDTYILPPIANATALSLGLDLGGEALDEASAELDQFRSLSEVMVFSGRSAIALPAANNITGPNGELTTGVVIQRNEDGIQDGHEVMFQLDASKAQYQAFLETWLTDAAPTVIDPDAP